MSVAVQGPDDDDEIPWPLDDTTTSVESKATDMPQDLLCEQATLGGMLLSKDVIGQVEQALRGPADFYRPAHQTIYRAILDMYGRNENVDPLTLADELDSHGELVGIDRGRNGQAYLHTLVHVVPVAANAVDYARSVRRLAERRDLIGIGQRIEHMARVGASGSTQVLLNTAMAELQSLAVGRQQNEKLSVADRWPDYLETKESGEDQDILSSPWEDLNEILTVKPGMFGTVGAATSGGKSLFAQNWATHVALRCNKPVLFGSLEMSGTEMLDRMLAAEARIPLNRVAKGGSAWTDEDWDKVAKVNDTMSRADNLILDDSGSLTVSQLRARIRTMAARDQLPALVVVDYIQLMTPDPGSESPVRAQEIARISRDLKMLAQEFKIVVIALGQFNRAANGRRPLPTDFKESSAIEQDSNFIILLHTEVDAENKPVKPGELEVHVAKNRQGPKGRQLDMAMQGHYARIIPMGAL
ncbi:replicative DNA helicase [Streptacidiphilus sp. EB129]|uniref:replicative DNA helicase n=1 Tax=Streptacidiphilus sp. EB129 TaxID=3156262 RepID=UPI003514C809